MTDSNQAKPTDLASGRLTQLLYWGLPVAAMVISGFFDSELVVWPPALTLMGIACVVNASRCHRVHCYFTGPWFLIMAALALAHGLDVVPLGSEGWWWIGSTTLVGGIAFYDLPERIWGKYSGRSGGEATLGGPR